MIDVIRHPGTWTISVQLLVLYCVAVFLFYVADSVNRSVSGSLKAGVQQGKGLNQAAVFGFSAASNALVVLAFVTICRKVPIQPRLAMAGVPLLLLLEQHVRAARKDGESRRLETLLAAGMALGIIGAAAALMPGAPLK